MPKEKEFKKLLVCEGQDGVTHYQVEINGQAQKPIAGPCSCRMPVVQGTYTVEWLGSV